MELYLLRSFCQVLKDRSFSAAAKSLRLTQSTISQQIARLEEHLGAKLFERVGHDVVPTALALELEQMANSVLDQVKDFEDSVQKKFLTPAGEVRYAMPESCQWTPHFRKIMGQIAELPEIKFQIEILPNDLIAQGLVEGRLDFGFILGEKLAPELRFEKFSDERYSAVARSRELFKPLEEGRYAELRVVSYPGFESHFITWAKAHDLWKELKAHASMPAVRVGTLAGAIHATLEGAGVAMIPTHCVAEALASGELQEWKSKPSIMAANPIYLTRRGREKLPKRVELVMGMLREAKLKLG